MTTKELIASVATEMGMQRTKVAELLTQTSAIVREALLDNKTVQIQDFGTLEVKKKNERLSVHPRTGVRTLTPPKLQLNFKQVPQLKETWQTIK